MFAPIILVAILTNHIKDNVTAHEFRPASVTGHESAQGGRHGDEEHENNYEYYIRTYSWTPLFGQKEVVLNVCSDAQPGTVT